MYTCLWHYIVNKPKRHRCKVHRACHPTSERQYYGMRGRISTIYIPSVPFLSTYSLLCHQIRKSTLQTCRNHRFMIINTDTVTGSSLYYLAIMKYTKLTAMIFFPIKQIAHITRFYLMHTIFLIELETIFHLIFIIGNITASFMMSYQSYSFATPIISNTLYIKIGIRFCETKLPSSPVFIPPFHQYTSQVIGSSKIDVTHCILCCGPMMGTGMPGVMLHVISPPNSNIAHRLYPGSIGYTTRFIKI